MKNETRSGLGLYTVGIAALFLAGFFLLVVFGAQSYRNTVSGQNANMHGRALLSYLSTTVKAYDAEGAVEIREDAGRGPVLVLRDFRSGYVLRIYREDGRLLEDFAEEGTDLSPENAQVIGETEQFRAEKDSTGLQRLSTDEGTVLLQLRSEEAAA